MATAKEEVTKLIGQMPDDATYEDVVRELAFALMVRRGLADSDAQRTISTDEMERRIRAWPR
jgi:hypothetical protein